MVMNFACGSDKLTARTLVLNFVVHNNMHKVTQYNAVFQQSPHSTNPQPPPFDEIHLSEYQSCDDADEG